MERRPEGGTGFAISFYQIPLSFRDREDRARQNEIRVEVLNDTLKNLAYLTDLLPETVYDLRVLAFVESFLHPGRFYRGPASLPRRVFVGEKCDPAQAFSKVHEVLEINAGIVAGLVVTVTTLVLLDAVNASDIGMVQLCKRLRLTLEPREALVNRCVDVRF